MTDSVLARLTALETMPMPELKAEWRRLLETEPPPYNRKFLVSRIAYRIQELAYGGLRPETVQRLEELAEQLDDTKPARPRVRHLANRPLVGTRLILEWQGTEYCVTVREHDYEYQGRPYRSLSSVARAITGTVWNGWTFFGLKSPAEISK